LSSSASSYTAIASDTYGRHSTNTINVSLSTSITLKYDGNGNLTNDGLRTLTYDDENQLTQVAGTAGWSNVFVYDAKMRRRITKQYSATGTETNEIRYIYDGNVVLQERNSANITGATYSAASTSAPPCKARAASAASSPSQTPHGPRPSTTTATAVETSRCS
jgi:hypothetical protein